MKDPLLNAASSPSSRKTRALPQPATIDDVHSALRAIGWGGIAGEWKMMQQVLLAYAEDEDKCLDGTGEPFGGITTEAGMKARQHAASCRRQEAAFDARQRRAEHHIKKVNAHA